MKIDSAKLLYEQIAEDIAGKIRTGNLNAGDSLEPVKTLQSRYDVSHVTVLRAFRELTDRQIIHKKGIRYLVSGSEKLNEALTLSGRNSTLGFFIRPFRAMDHDNYFNEINLVMEEKSAMAGMNMLRGSYTHSFNYYLAGDTIVSAAFPEMLRQLNAMSQRVCGMLLDERIPDVVLRDYISQNHIPAVLVNRATSCPVCSVSLPNQSAIELLFAKAMQLGYRHILYCSSANDNYCNDYDRYQAARSIDAKRNFPELHIHWRTNLEVPFKEYIGQLYNDIQHWKKPLILASSDGFAQEISSGLEKHNLEAGQEYGLCGFYAYKMPLPRQKTLSSIRIDTAAIGSKSVELLLSQIRHPWNRNHDNYEVPFEFVHGETM